MQDSDNEKEKINEGPNNESQQQNPEEKTQYEQDEILREEPQKAEKAGKKALSKKKKTAVIVSAVLAVIIAVVGAGLIYTAVKLGKLNKGKDDSGIIADDPIFEESDFSSIDADLNAASFKEAIKEWATNGGEVMSSKNVINVLLIGYDNRKNELSGNTDALMLMSLNRKTKKITMSSFLRDTYVYYETDDGKAGYNKINALCSIGGAQCLKKAIENHYKISVENYVAVNFASFEKLINEMGGINVTVQKYESSYYKTYFKKEIPFGENVLLDGFQALGFCRIRKCDADNDVSRVRRQQQVIKAIIDKVSEASATQVDDYLDAVLPYISTDLKNQEIISLGTKAIWFKWYNYEIQNMQLPTEESRYGYEGSTWIWAIDFPLSAQAVQKAIFGMTNIVLSEGRKTIIDILRGSLTGTGSSSAKATPSTTGENKEQETTNLATTTDNTTQSYEQAESSTSAASETSTTTEGISDNTEVENTQQESLNND